MEPGTELGGGKYRIVRRLGSGGMGAVYEALNTHTRKRVAIKCLLPSLALSSPDATERLVREAEASCRVRHPHVVDVYDIVRDGHSVFLVMEYLEGEPLTAAIDRGDLPLHRLIALLLPAMRAVAAAHAQGVVHRDIKPDNIFLARQTDVTDPVPKVLDFGISKLEARGTARISLTHAGAVMGTPIYMSYEQLLGVSDIDGRADVYAFGVVLYEALTGRPPYQARSHAEWLQRFSAPPIPPRQFVPQIPDALERLILSCLASDRAKRVASMDALIRELTPFASARPSEPIMIMPMASSLRSAIKTQRGPSLELPGKPAVARSGVSVSETAIGVSGPRRSLRVLVAVSGIALLMMSTWFIWRSGAWPASRHAKNETRLHALTRPSAQPPLAAQPDRPLPVLPPALVSEALRDERTQPAPTPEGRAEPAKTVSESARSGALVDRAPTREPAPDSVAAPRGDHSGAAHVRKHTSNGTDWGIY